MTGSIECERAMEENKVGCGVRMAGAGGLCDCVSKESSVYDCTTSCYPR